MAIRGVSHVAVGVADMERSLKFYRDTLGLIVTEDSTKELEAFGDVPPVRRRGVYLRWTEGDASFIVLDQHDRDASPAPRQFYELGVHHYGFWVDDVDQIVARARTLG